MDRLSFVAPRKEVRREIRDLHQFDQPRVGVSNFLDEDDEPVRDAEPSLFAQT
jgi:hypothetical protein